MGISATTFFAYQNEMPELKEAMYNGRAKGIATITNALFQKAKEGDNTAMIFYLKNRDPDNWEDVQKRHLLGKDGGAIQTQAITFNPVTNDNTD